MCCSVLQCITVCCSVLHMVSTTCDTNDDAHARTLCHFETVPLANNGEYSTCGNIGDTLAMTCIYVLLLYDCWGATYRNPWVCTRKINCFFPTSMQGHASIYFYCAIIAGRIYRKSRVYARKTNSLFSTSILDMTQGHAYVCDPVCCALRFDSNFTVTITENHGM